jgi:hypothetical protein
VNISVGTHSLLGGGVLGLGGVPAWRFDLD